MFANLNQMLRLLVLVLLVAGVGYFLSKYSPTSINKSANIQSTNPQNIPEMADILQTQDQDKRLKAARKLVERVGVEDALEILEHSQLPHTGEGHLAVHQIGFYAYQKYGVDSILHCRDYFLYGCYHGAIIEAASDQGFDIIHRMTDKCKDYSARHFQCVHAAGHAILAIWEYDLPKALKTCDDLYEKDGDVEILSSCHNGAFMENLFGVHDWDTNRAQKRDWLSGDPYFPCNGFGDKYQKGCWLNQAARIYQMQNGDIAKTAEICQKAGNQQYVAWCMDNLARQIHPLTNGDPAQSFELCKLEGKDWYDNCLVVNAGSFYSVGGRDQALYICQNVPISVKQDCYQTVIGQVIGDPIDKNQKMNICRKIETPFNNQCLSGLSSTI